MLSKNSKKLISFISDTKHNKNTKFTSKTENIIKHVYRDILESYNFLNTLKESQGTRMYSVENKISKPKNFGYDSFPEEVIKHIDKEIFFQVSHTFSLERKITVRFLSKSVESMDVYNKHMDMIFIWLFILNKYASKSCSRQLIIYLYFTSLEKKLPSANEVLDEIHVNSAFTSTCPKDAEIVIFRKEEWFKVFVHETFHNFGLDFSDMNNEICKAKILEIFPVNSQVNLYESYTEVWAEIINSCFCSFFFKKDEKMFVKGVEMFLSLERRFAFIQMVKTLKHMGLRYADLYSKNNLTRYKEKTNVLSYYVMKCIVMNDYQRFLSWCQTNHLTLYQFKKTHQHLLEYCKFIENGYKTKSMLEEVNETETFLRHTRNSYFLTNMRMSICELG